MMQSLDTTLPKDRERDLQLHLGACHTCRSTWNALDETVSLLPEWDRDETHQLPPLDGFWSCIQSRLPVISKESQATRERVRCSQRGWTGLSLLGLFLLGISFIGLVELDGSGPIAVIGGFIGWVYAWLKGAGLLLNRVLGPDWIVLAEWGLPLLTGGLLVLVGRRFMRGMTRPGDGGACPADKPALREGRMVG